jgi:hypothetical protein
MKAKNIMLDTKTNKICFTIVDETTNAVETINANNWLKSSLKDRSTDFMQRQIIKGILAKERQFNKKVSFNIWSKQDRRTFEQKLSYLISNNFYNITKNGIE